MKIIYPTDEDMGYLSKRGAHFGKASFYTIVTLKDDKIEDVEVVKNKGHETGACTNAVSNIMSFGPDALVVSGIGGSPAKGFADAGLDVYYDKVSPTVKDSIDMLIANKLEKLGGNGTCSAH
jgi:predicted Fe-Mo cluster-binding NifX family protein